MNANVVDLRRADGTAFVIIIVFDSIGMAMAFSRVLQFPDADGAFCRCRGPRSPFAIVGLRFGQHGRGMQGPNPHSLVLLTGLRLPA